MEKGFPPFGHTQQTSVANVANARLALMTDWLTVGYTFLSGVCVCARGVIITIVCFLKILNKRVMESL